MTNWNAGAQRIKGDAPDEVIGQHFSIFYTPKGPAAAEGLATALREGTTAGRGLAAPQAGTIAFGGDRSVYEEGVLAGFAKMTRHITEWEMARNRRC